MKVTREHLGSSISFQSYIFNYETGMLTTGRGDKIFMEHRLRDLFLVLLKYRDDFVSKNELVELAWKDTVVSEQSVSKAISDLRKFLVTHKLEDLKITTIRKLGYRLEIEEPSGVNRRYSLKAMLPYTVIIIVLLIFLIMHH